VDIHVADFEHYKIEYSLQVVKDLQQIRADADQLIKAFHNLIQNAIQAMPNGGQFKITIFSTTGDRCQSTQRDTRNDKVMITFEDQGQGIPTETVKNIFDPFFTTKDTGTGLGLAITHKVITEHSGEIKVKSREGIGTTFTIWLPMHWRQINEDPAVEYTDKAAVVEDEVLI
jgi:signal transduction histidine kinase